MPVLYSALLFQPGVLSDEALEAQQLDLLQTEAMTLGLDADSVTGLTQVFEGSIDDARDSDDPNVTDNLPDFLARGDYDPKAMAGMRLAIHAAHTTTEE